MENEKDFAPIPMNLFRRCYQVVRTTHRRKRIGDVSTRITAAGSDDMVALALIPAALTLMGSIHANFQFRICGWIAGALLVLASVLFRWWMLFGLPVIAIADRWLASTDKGFLMTEASFLLALDMLRSDFAGWGSAFPDARRRAIEIAGDSPLYWLDYYLPRRANLTPEVVRGFGPKEPTEAAQ